MKVLLAGDTHGNVNQMEYLCWVASYRKCSLIIQLGDFGLWPGKGGDAFLKRTQVLLEENDLELWWLDGNHEDHVRIRSWLKDNAAYKRRHQVTPRIFYMPRGYRFELDGVRFMALGGAWSIDKDARTPYIDWWPEEELTQADVERALEVDTPLDVLLTHDLPDDWEVIGAMRVPMAAGGVSNRRAVSAVSDRLKPKLHVHGHMHVLYQAVTGTRTVVGLDRDGTAARSWAVLDTAARRLVSVPLGEVAF